MTPRFLIIFAIALVLVTLAGYFGLRQVGSPVASGASPDAEPIAAPAETASGMVTLAGDESEIEFAATPEEEGAIILDADSTPEQVALYWDDQLSNLLDNDEMSDRELGKRLMELATRAEAPLTTRLDAFRNALVFADDENYDADIKPLALRTDLPESFNDEILEDILNRDPEIILPVARQIAATSSHPLAGAVDEYVKSIEEEMADAVN